MRYYRLREGVTLIELLTVIAIMMVLAAIILPAQQHVKEASYRASCESNLKQLMAATALYADDWTNSLPPVDSIDGGPGPNEKGQQADVDPRSLYNLLKRYARATGAFKCPITPEASPWDPDNGNYGVLNYQYNRNACVKLISDTKSYTPAKKLDGVTEPADSVLIFDWLSFLGDLPMHKDGLNYGYVDGHVEWHSRATYSPGGTYPRFQYGGQ